MEMTETSKPAADGGDSAGGDIFDDFKEMLAEQSERQGRLRHVQQFLTSPLFLDLRDQPITVSDPPEAIIARKRDLDYRIRVLESLVSLLIEERDALDRTRSANDPVTDPANGPATDPASTGSSQP
jgi:hypothetical protein